jgi:hypothetical protein
VAYSLGLRNAYKQKVRLSNQEILLAKNCHSIKKLNEMMLHCAANIFGCGTANNDTKGYKYMVAR